MPFSEVFSKQAALVVRALPEVAREDCFALKGTRIRESHRQLK